MKALLAIALAACVTQAAVNAPPRPPSEGVPLAGWLSGWHSDPAPDCEPWWLRPATLCSGGVRARLEWDGCKWRCVL